MSEYDETVVCCGERRDTRYCPSCGKRLLSFDQWPLQFDRHGKLELEIGWPIDEHWNGVDRRTFRGIAINAFEYNETGIWITPDPRRMFDVREKQYVGAGRPDFTLAVSESGALVMRLCVFDGTSQLVLGELAIGTDYSVDVRDLRKKTCDETE